MKQKKLKGLTTFDYVNAIILGILCITCVLPFVNLLAVSFSGSTAVAAGKVGFLPVDFTLASYEYVLESGKFFTAMLVSIERVVLGTLINLALMVLVAYPLSKDKEGQLFGRKFYTYFFMITMLIGGGMIPTYLVVSKLGLKNTLWSLVLPGALPISNMIILMNFIRELPEEMEEAASLDGATPIQILLQIILPVLKPALATVGLFCIVGHWNDWFSGMIYMSDVSKYPLQTYLQSIIKSFDQLLLADKSHDIASLLAQMNARTGRAAQLFLGALPIMIVYPFLQKYFTKGLVLGSVKG